MSVQAISWALEDAPDVPPRLVSTLIALANYANRLGKGAFPGNETLAEHTRKSVRQVKRDLDELVELRLISVGDQRLVAHIRADRRPRVWDLAVHQERPRGDTDATPQPVDGGSSASSRSGSRGDADDPPQGSRGDIQGLHGVSSMTPDPKEEPREEALPPTGVVRDARERARPAHPRAAHVSAAELNATAFQAGAWKIVAPWRESHETKYTYTTYRKVAKKVDEILADNGVPELLAVALRDWDTRGKTVEFLRNCYDDAVHATKPVHLRPVMDSRPATTDVRTASALLLAEQYEAQERAEARLNHRELPGMAS